MDYRAGLLARPELPYLPSALQTLTVVVAPPYPSVFGRATHAGRRRNRDTAPRREARIRRLNWSLCRRGATAKPALQHVSTCCRFALAGPVAHPIQGAAQVTIRRANRRAIATTGIGSLVAGLVLAASGADPAGRRRAVGQGGHLPRDQLHVRPLPGAVGGRERGLRRPGPRRAHGWRVRLLDPRSNSGWGNIVPPLVEPSGSTGTPRARPSMPRARGAGAPEPCTYDSALTADDPACTPPVEPAPCT